MNRPLMGFDALPAFARPQTPTSGGMPISPPGGGNKTLDAIVDALMGSSGPAQPADPTYRAPPAPRGMMEHQQFRPPPEKQQVLDAIVDMLTGTSTPDPAVARGEVDLAAYDVSGGSGQGFPFQQGGELTIPQEQAAAIQPAVVGAVDAAIAGAPAVARAAAPHLARELPSLMERGSEMLTGGLAPMRPAMAMRPDEPSIPEGIQLPDIKAPDPELVDRVSAIGDLIDTPTPPFVPDPNDVRAPNKQVAQFLQDRFESITGGRKFDKHTKENVEFISDVFAKEAEREIAQGKISGKGSAFQWYRDTLDKARGHVGRKYPEVVTQTNHRDAFDFALAVTSNGQKVPDNSRYGLEVYEYWRKTGRMPEHLGWGKEAGAMRSSFATYNKLLDALGEERLQRFLSTPVQVKTLRNMGFKIPDEAADEMLPASVIFGPKIGGGFFSNLQGDFSRLTPDRWFTRTWGRITGTLMNPNPQLAKKHYREFMKWYGPRRIAAAERDLGLTLPSKEDLKAMDSETREATIDALGQRIFDVWARKGFVDKTNPLYRTSRSINNRLMPKEAPSTSSERKMMREVMERTKEKLHERGLPLDISDIQATVWYPEQRLWDQLGSKQIAKEQDYARSFEQLIGPDTGANAGGGTGQLQQASASPRLSDREARRIVKAETLRNLRAGPRGGDPAQASTPLFESARRSAESVQLGDIKAGVIATHVPKRAVANKLKDINVSTEPWHELTPGLESSQAFNRAITDAKQKLGPKGAAVYVYDPEELANAKLFVTADGNSGFAIKPDGDIVSVFNNSNRPNAAISALQLAVERGGTKLDAFDTILPEIYSQAGFKVVRREPWNKAYEQDMIDAGWDFDYFKDFNGGRPDVVYMEYDPQASGYYE